MKTIGIVSLALFLVATAHGQYSVTVYPYPNPSTVDSASVVSANDTAKVYTIIPDSAVTVFGGDSIRVTGGTPFAGILIGMKITGYTALDSATWVTNNIDDSVLVVSPPQGVKTNIRIKAQQASATFYNATVGFPVMGTNIPNGTFVVASDSFFIAMSKKATATSTRAATIYSGTYKGSQTAYASGDLVGIPFTFYLPAASGRKFDGVYIVDSSAQTGNLDVVLYDAAVVGYSADNAAFAPGGASFDNVVGYATLTTFKAIGTNTSYGFVNGLAQPFAPASGGWYYGVVIARGSGNYLGNRTLALKLLFTE